MRKRNGRLLALLMSVLMTVTSVDAYTLQASAAEQKAVNDIFASTTDAEDVLRRDDRDVSGNQTGEQTDTSSGDEVSVDVTSGDTQCASADAMQSAPISASGDYLIDQTAGFTVTDVTVEAKSYLATAELKLNWPEDYEDSASLHILYTADPDADFFKGTTSVSSQSLGETYKVTYDSAYSSRWYDHEIQIGSTSTYQEADGLLKPSTTYTYRVVRTGTSTWDSSTRKYNYTYYFLTTPQTFTTAAPIETSTVTIDDITVKEYGYDTEIITTGINNPNEELLGNTIIVQKGKNGDEMKDISLDSTYDYESKIKTWTVPTNQGELEFCVGVYTGQGELSYIRKDIPLQRQDAAGRKIDLTVTADGMTLSADAVMEPWYNVDYRNYLLYLYYRQADTGSGYRSRYYSNGSGRFTAISGKGEATAQPDGTLSAEKAYEYYAVVKDSAGNIITSKGSEEEPLTFQTGALVTYTVNDFADKNLFVMLEKQKGAPLTNAKLEAMTEFSTDSYAYSTSSIDGDDAIGTLEDIPKLMPNLEKLTVLGQNVTDITPLKQMKSLREVTLSYNDIAALPDLSECKWTKLKLDYNYIKPEAVDTAKLPGALTDTDVTGGHYRENTLTLADTYYVDNDGKYPLIFLNNAAKSKYRTYTATVTIGDVTKEYKDARVSGYSDYSDYYGSGSNGGRLFIISDLKADFGLVKEQKYTVKITVKDQYGAQTEFAGEISYADASGGSVGDIYVSAADTARDINISLTGKYNSAQIKSVSVLKGTEKVWTNSSIYCYSGGSGMRGLYQGALGEGFTSGYYSLNEYVNYSETNVSAYINALKFLSAGAYDIVMELTDGTSFTFAGKFHVTNVPVVTGINYGLSGYDNTGAYYYIKLEGYNLDAGKVWPVIVDQNGTEYTTVEEMELGVYKLKKKDNWAQITETTSDTYYCVKLGTQGEVIDQTSDDAKKIDATYLRNKSGMDLMPISVYYNWKKQTIELAFGSTVPKDTEVSVSVGLGSSDTLATATGKTNAKGRLSLIPKTEQGSVYVLKRYEDYTLTLTSGKDSAKTYFEAEWYNYSSSEYTEERDTMDLYRVNMNYYVEEGLDTISLQAYGQAAAHSTNQLYVKLYKRSDSDSGSNTEIAKSDMMSYSRDKNNNRDVFTLNDWKLGTKLEPAYYDIRLYETVDGKEKELASNSFKVLKKLTDGFYQDYQSVSYSKADATKASLNIELPLVNEAHTTDASALGAIIKALKLQVEVFDAEGKAVNATATPNRISGSYIYFTISGLDKSTLGYYFRVTCDGKTGYTVDGAKYYSDDAHGKWAARSGYISIGTYDSETAYSYIYISDFEDDIPYTVKFYELADISTCVHSFVLTKEKLNGNSSYALTAEDLKPLSSDEVYHCVVISNRGKSTSYDGYFAVRGTAAAVASKPLVVKQKQDIKSLLGSSYKKYTVTPKGAASVNGKGILTAKKAAGSVTVTGMVKSGKKWVSARSVSIRIEKPVMAKKTITATKPGMTINASENITGVTTAPDSWLSSKPAVAEIDAKTGVITTKAKGSTKITAVYGEGKNAAKYTFTVKVNIPAMSKTKATLLTGAVLKLGLKNVPKDKAAEIIWKSSDSTAATVDETGKVTALSYTSKTEGKVTITATVDGASYSCEIQVKKPEMKKAAINLKQGKTQKLALKNTKLKDIKWTSLNEAVATVDATGKVTGVSKGTAKIQATVGGVTCVCEVTVE